MKGSKLRRLIIDLMTFKLSEKEWQNDKFMEKYFPEELMDDILETQAFFISENEGDVHKVREALPSNASKIDLIKLQRPLVSVELAFRKGIATQKEAYHSVDPEKATRKNCRHAIL